MSVRAILVLSFGLAISPYIKSHAQSEFLRYKETGLGAALAYSRGDATERAYEASATVAFDGALDLTGAVSWSWMDDGPSPGFDARAYGIAIAYHPRKSNHDTGVQAKLRFGYASIGLRHGNFSSGYESDDSRTAAFAEGGLYLAADHTTPFALVPMVTVGRAFLNVGEASTYYSAQIAGVYRKKDAAAYLRLGMTADSDETLVAIAIGLLGSVGHSWE